MLKDPCVSASIRTLILSCLSQGDHLCSPVREKGVTAAETARFDLGQEIAAFCRSVLDGLNPHRMSVWADLLEAMAHGYRIAELVYRDAEPGELEEFLTLKGRGSALLLAAVKPKSNDVLSFVVDEFFNVLGFTSKRVYGVQAFDGDWKEILPREKFAVLSWAPKDCDPRGSSILQAVYTPWLHKQYQWEQYLKYLVQFASPQLIALLNDAAPPTLANEFDEETGLPVKTATSVLAALTSLFGGTAAALWHVKELLPIEMQGNGEAFLSAMGFYDRQIEKGITGQELAGSQGKYGTRAQASVHADTRDLLTNYGKQVLAETIHDDILTPLVRYNYGPEAVGLTPEVSLVQVRPEDRSDYLRALASVGYKLHRSQFPTIDAENGIGERAEDWMDDAEEEVPALPAADAEEDPEAEGADGEEE